MTAPVKVTQADIDAAKALVGLPDDPAHVAMDPAVQAFARHRIAALEEAARVAEDRHEHWRMPHPDDAKPGEVCCDVSACRDIATAIRSLKGPNND